MTKSSKLVHSAIGRTNLLMFDPSTLNLVTDPASPLYDERVHNPPNDRMVRSIKRRGVVEPIVVAKNPETGKVDIVDGRQRVINAIEANRQLVDEGELPIQVPGVVRKYAGNGGDLAEVMVLTNEIREEDKPLNRARKMQRLAELGRDEEAIATVFGCSAQTVKNTLALLECTAAVQKAVEAGKVNVGQALKLSKLKPDEQREKVAELAKAGEGAAPRERARQQREVMGDAKPKMMPRAAVAAKRDTYAAGSPEHVVLGWVLGVE